MTLELDFDPYASIDANSTGLADAADGHLDQPIPTCPGWTMADLVWHLHGVQYFWGQLVQHRLRDPERVPAQAARPNDNQLIPTFRDGSARFLATLRQADPAASVWTWSEQQDAAFVIRHQVQETAVHRWDAQHAIGAPFAIAADAAADSIEEFLTWSMGERDEDDPDLGGPICLVAVDAGRSWIVSDAAERTLHWQRGDPPTGSTLVRGTASDLLLWVYRRISPPQLDVTGDAGRLSRFAGFTQTD